MKIRKKLNLMKKNHTTKSPSSYDFLIFGKSLFIVSETESIFKKKIRNKNMIMITKMVMIMIIKIPIIIIIMIIIKFDQNSRLRILC